MTDKSKHQYDIFVSYASEDKGFVRDLVNSLSEKGVSVWYDEGEIRIGDSIMRHIEEGLENSKYFLLVISPEFFSRSWSQFETGVALSKFGKSHILPVFRRTNRESLRQHMPFLADRVGISAEDHTINEIADKVATAIVKQENG